MSNTTELDAGHLEAHLIEPVGDAYAVLTDGTGAEISKRVPVRFFIKAGQPATQHQAGTVDCHVDRTVELSHTARSRMSVGLVICSQGYGPLLEVRRVTLERGEAADLRVQQTTDGQRKLRDLSIAPLERELGIGDLP